MSLVVARPFHQDPYAPVLRSSPPLSPSLEQHELIKDILRKACSDSRFAEKAYAAIIIVLTAGNTPVPTITSITPDTAAIGSPSFLLHVQGTNFNANSKILWNGTEELTNFVSPTELTTMVNMDTAEAAIPLPVAVLDTITGMATESLTFVLTPAP